jgi:DNA-binding NarL/FixJ family response regulator
VHSAIGSLLHWRSDQDRRAGARRLAAAGERADARLIGPEGDSVADLDQPLTPRESEVLLLLAKGASNKLIARRLGISVHTAKFHVGQLLD